MRQRVIALWVSAGLHLAVLVALVLLAGNQGVAARTIQLNGSRVARDMGRDMLAEVLRGVGMSLRLESTESNDAVGLAWWSPAVGMWLAVDRLPTTMNGESLDVFLQIADGDPERIGSMEIDDTGSGRIVSVWEATYPPAGTPITLMVAERRRLRWSESDVLLTGVAPMRAPDFGARPAPLP